MKIGYSYWGYLGDTKYDEKGKMASTPDGNAIYSWSIIHQLINEGHTVFQIMPNRDYVGLGKEGKLLFGSWCTNQRYNSLFGMVKMYKIDTNWLYMTKEKLFNIWYDKGLSDCDVILHEWRMLIPGRNDDTSKMFNGMVYDYQPDYFIQECLFEFCDINKIPVIIFDLDYKITQEEISRLPGCEHIWLFELGFKWQKYPQALHVEIPFDFNYINEFDITKGEKTNNLVYVGNRYERDWCIDKYIPTEISGVTVYGNWLESNRDSKDKWPNITFGPRVQTYDMSSIYQNSIATVLLAKQEYLENSFMTARIIESIFYGCVPLFIEEYGESTIRKYAGIYYKELTVRSKSDIINIVYELRYNDSYRRNIIAYLREHLSFMDVRKFVNHIYDVVDEEARKEIRKDLIV